jgi:hypothetical protein
MPQIASKPPEDRERNKGDSQDLKVILSTP